MSDDEDDFEDITESGDDLIKVGQRVFSRVPYKKTALLSLVLFLVLSSNFVALLENIPDAFAVGCPTTKGSLLQMIVIILAFIVIDMMVNANLV